MSAVVAILGVWFVVFGVLVAPSRWAGTWIAGQTKSSIFGYLLCIACAQLIAVYSAVILVFANFSFLPHFNSESSQIGFAHLIFFVPALFALVLGFRRARSLGVEPKQTAPPVLEAPQQSNGALRFIRSTLPVPILYALIGVTVFGLLDATTGRFFGQFISDRPVAVVLSALAGAVMGYLLGWHIVSTNGLPPNTTPYEMNAALRKRAQNGPSSQG